ncbi:MAG: hypothetical protein ACYTGR_06290, partial [Planctomycetota bacterium]
VEEPTEERQITELIAPGNLREDEAIDDPLVIRDLQAEKGWIETSDPETGKLAQRYRFKSIDPNPEQLPPGWFRMNEPRAEVFLTDGRVVTITGDSALANEPTRALESGTITGNVEIRMYDPGDGASVDIGADTPALALSTPEAVFDHTLGEVRCEGEVVISTPDAEMPGRRLWLQFNDVADEFELRIEEVDYIRLTTAAAVATAPGHAGPAAPRRIASGGPPIAAPDLTSGAFVHQDPPSASADEQRYYLLTLVGPVHARQREADTIRNVHGNDLTIVFSQSDDASEPTVARAAPAVSAPTTSAPSTPLPLSELTAHLVMAAVPTGTPRPADDGAPTEVPVPLPGEAVITCGGPLSVVPLRDESLIPEITGDSVVRLGGTPVTVHDEKLGAHGSGSQLVYHTLDRRVEMIGSESHPLLVKSPRADLTGERFWLSQERGVGGLDGTGSMALREERELQAVEADDPPLEAITDLDITWTERMDFDLADDDGGESLALRSATFVGGVVVRNDDINLDADTMTVGFAPGPGEGDDVSVESIDASGSVDILSVADSGRMRCEKVHMDLLRTADGKTIPSRLKAETGVDVRDQDQRMWCDELRVTFREVPRDPNTPEIPDNADEAATASGGAADLFKSGSVAVHMLDADGDVQMLMADGARAFGDKLVADAIAGTAALTGDDVVVAEKNFLVDHGNGATLTIDRGSGEARWNGPGQARFFKTPILLDTPDRIERPRVAEKTVPTEMKARWNDDMTYESADDDDAGAIELTGEVAATMASKPLETNTMSGQLLRLVFGYVEGPAAAEDATVVPGSDEEADETDPLGSFGGNGRKREIVKLIARGNADSEAKLESRTWTTDDRTDKPKVFYVAGDFVSYDDRRFEAEVVGSGTLLLRDETPEAESARPRRPGEVTPPFSGRGTTMFQFSERMHMTRLDETTVRITMTGDVRVSHRALDGETASMTGEHFEVYALRSTDDAAVDAPDARSGAGTFALGGRMEFKRIVGRDGVFVTTATREVESDSLDYNITTGIARLAAKSGRVVTVMTQQSKFPYSAEQVEWDMTRDTIRVVNANAIGGG